MFKILILVPLHLIESKKYFLIWNFKDFRKQYRKEKDFYLGFDDINGMHFMCLSDIMMIDIDYDKSDMKNVQDVKKRALEQSQKTGDTYIEFMNLKMEYMYL